MCGCKDIHSEECLRLTNVLLTSVETLKRDSYIDVNVDDNTIRVAILAIQDIIVEKVIGSCLFDYLREIIDNDTIELPEHNIYKVLLSDYLFPIFSYGVQAEISIPLSFKTRNAGSIRTEDDSFTNTPLDELKYTNSWYRSKVDFYIERAIKFLSCNKECIPQLCCTGDCACDTQSLQRPYSTGLNLGKTYPNMKPYKGGRRGYGL